MKTKEPPIKIDAKVKAAYPGIPVRCAYTSHIIRHKLAKQGRHLDSPEVALAKMLDEKFTHLAVQSLHTIGGPGYHDLIDRGYVLPSGNLRHRRSKLTKQTDGSN